MAEGVRPDQQRDILQTIKRFFPNARIFAFGSRITKTASPYSDLDIAIDAGIPLTWSQLALLKQTFSDSDLPFQVDLVDMALVDPEFQQLILRSASQWE